MRKIVKDNFTPFFLVWLSGPPGAGKSTTCQLLAKENDFVYYEGDCIMGCLNPFVPVDVDNPSIAGFSQPPLKVHFSQGGHFTFDLQFSPLCIQGIPKEFVDAITGFKPVMDLMTQGRIEEADFNMMKPFYTLLAEHVGQQKARIGGNFAVGQAVTSRELR